MLVFSDDFTLELSDFTELLAFPRLDLNVEVIFLLLFTDETGRECVDFFDTVGLSTEDLALASGFAVLVLIVAFVASEPVFIEVSGAFNDDFNDESGWALFYLIEVNGSLWEDFVDATPCLFTDFCDEDLVLTSGFTVLVLIEVFNTSELVFIEVSGLFRDDFNDESGWALFYLIEVNGPLWEDFVDATPCLFTDFCDEDLVLASGLTVLVFIVVFNTSELVFIEVSGEFNDDFNDESGWSLFYLTEVNGPWFEDLADAVPCFFTNFCEYLALASGLTVLVLIEVFNTSELVFIEESGVFMVDFNYASGIMLFYFVEVNGFSLEDLTDAFKCDLIDYFKEESVYLFVSIDNFGFG